jgi:CheY-like chemotaxis protein
MTEALIIDDNRTTADALGQMLTVLGFKARVAYGSRAAMALLGSGFTPQFICLDINMPGVNGTEILAYLRREPHLLPVPVFVITSDDQPETRRMVMRLGATGMIIKPATIDALEDALRKLRFLK